MRLPPRTRRVTTLHTGSNQSTELSGATSSPSAQGGTRKKDPGGRHPGKGGGVCHICREVTYPSITEGSGSLVAPGSGPLCHISLHSLGHYIAMCGSLSYHL